MATNVPPMLPTDADNKSLLDFIDLQKKSNEVSKEQLSLRYEMRDINISVENQLADILKRQQDLLGEQNTAVESLIHQYKEFYKANGAVTQQWYDKTNGLIDQFSRTSQNINALQARYNYEKERELKLAGVGNEKVKLFNELASKHFNIKVKELDMQKEISDQLGKTFGLSKKVALTWASIFVLLVHAWNTFNKFDEWAAKFRKSMGLIRRDSVEIEKQARRLAIDFMHVGVTIEGAYKSIEALGKEMGSVRIISAGLLQTTSLLSAQLGVSEEHAAGFLRNMASVAKNTMESQQSTAWMAADLAGAAGVPLDKVMGDVATKTSATLSLMSKFPNAIVRTAIEARRLNTTLDNMAKSAEAILNFTESVQSEMEASVLLGRSLNLQKARELSYAGKLEEKTKELIRLAKQVDFTNLDYFQKGAVARAMGLSVDELNKMIVAEREWENARNSADPKIRKMVEDYEKLRDANEESAKASAKNFEQMVMTKNNAALLTSISQKWESVLTKASAIFLPLINGILTVVDKMMGAAPFFMVLTGIISKAYLASTTFLQASMALVGYSSRVLNASLKMERFLVGIGKFAKFFAVGGKFIPVLGEILMIGEAVWRTFSIINDAFKDFGQGNWLSGFARLFLLPFKVGYDMFWGLISNLIPGFRSGMLSVSQSISDCLVGPFKDAWDWISEFFIGHSPSKLGQGIVSGIISVGTMIFDALTSPFQRFFEWLKSVPVIGKMFGGGGMTINSVEQKAAASYIDVAKVTPEGTTVVGMPKKEEDRTKSTESPETTDDRTYNKLCELVELLKSGKIQTNTFLDGQLMSATLARQTEFRGGYGVNKVG